jgi:hypothetical protein
MYSTLDKIDLVTQDKGDGRATYHQTDHRETAEIQAEEELSTLFALARTLNPQGVRKPDEPAPLVRYVCFARPPDSLRRAVAAAGGELMVNDEVVPWTGAPAEPGLVADEAFRALAERVSREEGLPLIEAGLVKLEAEALAQCPDMDAGEDGGEIAYWTWVVKLAAVAGEVLRRAHGGRWVRDEHGLSLVPFAFSEPGGSILNPCGKAEKFLAQGPRESLTQLLRLAEDTGSQAHAPMLTFKPHDWDARSEVVCRPLLEHAAEMDARLPLIAYGEDLPNSFALFKKDGQRELAMEELHARTLPRLRAVKVELVDVDLGDLKLLVATGDYYAAEKLLDQDFMSSMHARLEAPLLATGVPRKGVLMMVSGLNPPETMAKFMAIVGMEHAKQDAGQPLSPVVILVQEGRPCGVIKPSTAGEDGDAAGAPSPGPAPRKPGFFGRLLGKKG